MKNNFSFKLMATIGGIFLFVACTNEESDVTVPESKTLISADNGKITNEPESKNDPKTHIPNDAFEQYLIDKGYDDVLDDYVLTANISAIEEVDLYSYSDISDLTGLEDFDSLTKLSLEGNAIASFDATKYKMLTNLFLQDLPLTDLTIDNTGLKNFGFRLLALETLLISNNLSLEIVGGEDSNIGTFTVEKNKVLDFIDGIDIVFGALIVANNCNLETYFCNSCTYKSQAFIANDNLENIGRDFDDGLFLESLTINNNPKVLSLDITDFKVLKALDIKNSAFSSIDISQNTSLVSLNVAKNPLTCIEVNKDQFDNIPNNWVKDPEDCYALNCH